MDLNIHPRAEIRIPYSKDEVYILGQKEFWRYYGGPSESTDILIEIVLDDDIWYLVVNTVPHREKKGGENDLH